MSKRPRHPLRAFLKWLLVGLILFCGWSFTGNFTERAWSSTEPDHAALIQQGRSHYQAGQFSQAADLWQQAVIGYAAQGDVLNQARGLGYLALAQQQLGVLAAAQQSITRGLALAQSQPTTIDQQLVLAQLLNTQGSLQLTQGQAETAIASWQAAASLYAAAGDEEKRLGSLLNQAQAEQTLGLFRAAQQTLADIERSLTTLPDSALKAMTLRSLADGLRATGHLPEARRMLEQSLAIAQTAAPSEIPAILMSLANVARSQQAPTAALNYYQQAAMNASPLMQLQANLNQFSLLVEMQQWERARSLLPTIQAQLQVPPSRAAIYARINFARSLMKSQLLDDRAIAQILSSAVSQAQQLQDDRAQAYALGTLGSLYEQTQQWRAAQTLTEQAILLAQAVNAADIAYQWQWQLGRLLKAQGRVGEAIAAYQAAFETLQSLRSNLLATSPDLQFSFRESVEPVYRDLVELLLRRSGDRPQTISQDNLKQARQIIESLQLAELDNFFRTACLEGQQVAIDQIPDTHAAVIYPILLEDRLEVIVSLPGQPLRQYTTMVTQAIVETTLQEWRQELEKPFTTMRGKQLGQQIYDWLIRSIASDLHGEPITTLAFVLNASLRNVPMAALFDGNQYLIERYSIALTPSLQMFKPHVLERDRLQAILAGLTEERSGFSALTNVERELQDIQAEISSRVLLNETFTSEALKAQLDRNPTPIVHLATHGQFSSDANQTFILAWDKPINVQELGVLLRSAEEQRLDDVFSFSNAIELLVLSACETAAGDQRAALGLAGIAVQAGARSTLASLWSLDDESGAKLMEQLYRILTSTSDSKAEVLRQAQLTLLRDPDFRHPRYWAPYVLVGNWL